MISRSLRRRARRALFLLSALAPGALYPALAIAQDPHAEAAEWAVWGATHGSTRYSPLEQIEANNFEQLEVAWIWRGENFGPPADSVNRATPIFAGGKLFTVAGTRRTVVAIDPATGETLWTFREPHTGRWERSPRKNYGKGVAYAEIDGRGIVYYVSPAFFLHALDAETGAPLSGFGAPVHLPGFPETGTIDLLSFLDRAQPHDPYTGVASHIGNISSSSPPLVIDGIIVVGSSAEQGFGYTRLEQVPGDILAFDARSGAHLWTFEVIPGPGEFGHESWENDAWVYTGNINAWAPFSADPELGLVFVPTDAPTNDAYGGFRPGDNLFGTSILALDIRTGRRVWHFQTVHHDIFDYDNSVAPILLDLTVAGERIPALVQATKQGLIFAFDRRTGEPIWPIEERPVPRSEIPGEQSAPTQPIPTRPAPYEMQGLSEDDLVAFTPELHARALERVSGLKLGPLYNPPIHRDNAEGYRGSLMCPGVMGGTDIQGGAVADPESGIVYVPSIKSCFVHLMVPGNEVDDGTSTTQPGETIADWVQGRPQPLGSIDGIPIFAPPYGRITAIDMNTGEHLWWVPNGDTPEAIAANPLLAGVEIPNTGQPSHASALLTRTLLIHGEGRGGRPRLHALDKQSGARVGTLEIPASTTAPPITFFHQGQQYVVLPVAGHGHLGSLVALRLPAQMQPETR